MKKEEFRKWLVEIDGRDKNQARDHLSRVKRIENVLTDLDGSPFDIEDACKKDQGQTLLNRLTLGNREKMPTDTNLPTDMMGISRIRSSLRKYIDYYAWRETHSNK